MDENTAAETAAVETKTDAFLDGWNDISPDLAADDTPPETATEKETAPEGKAPADTAETPAVEETATAETEPTPPAEPSWDIKYMGESRTMTAKEVTPELLQKALDYDRVRGKYDEAKPVMDMFTQFAKQAGMNIPEYVAYIRQQTKMNDGMSEAEAKRAVELEDREAAVAAKEAEQKEAEAAANAGQAKIQADLREFAKAFPEIYEQAKGDPKAIPDEVWADVNAGRLSLTAAYSRYAVNKAKAEAMAAEKTAATAKQNASNAARSTGSLKSAGSDTVNKDPFLDGWNSIE